jgi:hypothetical protein
MAKPARAGARANFKDLYDVLHDGFWNEQLVVLQSGFHDVETSLAGALKDPIKSKRSTLGHVDLNRPEKIYDSQITAALRNFLSDKVDAQVICYKDAFRNEPDERVGHFDVNVNTDWMHAGAKNQRDYLAAQLDEVRQGIRAGSISYDCQLQLEMDASRQDALKPNNTRRYVAISGVDEETYRKFVASAAFAEVPIVWLYAALLTRLMTAHVNRKIKGGDMTDIDAMATYLPYCDVYGADRFMAEVARSLQIPQRFGCQLFDSSKDGVAGLVEYLRVTLATVAPVNVPSLSIFVAPSASIKKYSFKVFSMLGNQASMADRQGN